MQGTKAAPKVALFQWFYSKIQEGKQFNFSFVVLVGALEPVNIYTYINLKLNRSKPVVLNTFGHEIETVVASLHRFFYCALTTSS